MNTLKKFSVETHKGWSSFQAWIKKWNKIMAVIFSALGIILLLSTVIVNALEVHEENQDLPKPGNGTSRLNLLEICKCKRKEACILLCDAGNSTDISKELNFHWETNPYCVSTGMSIEISSTVQFPTFTVPTNWLNGNFKLTELQIDLENIFVVSEDAFAGKVFTSMRKLILINFHLHAMDARVLQNLVMNQNYEHLTITKKYKENSANTTVEVQIDSTFYSEIGEKYNVHNINYFDDTIRSGSGSLSQALIISLTIFGCILSFSLGLLIRYNLYKQKKFWNNINKANRVIFVVDTKAKCLKQSVAAQK